MFRGVDDWPPGPDRYQPAPRAPWPGQRRRERHAMIAVALLLAATLIGPFAGSSLVTALVATVRAAMGR